MDRFPGIIDDASKISRLDSRTGEFAQQLFAILEGDGYKIGPRGGIIKTGKANGTAGMSC